MSTSGPSRQTVNASYHPGGVSVCTVPLTSTLPTTLHFHFPPPKVTHLQAIGLRTASHRFDPPDVAQRPPVETHVRPAYTSQGASPSLRRARRPFKLGNAVVGGAVALFAAGVYAYSISSVKQDDFVSATPFPFPVSASRPSRSSSFQRLTPMSPSVPPIPVPPSHLSRLISHLGPSFHYRCVAVASPLPLSLIHLV
jgi:hypothetical protein